MPDLLARRSRLRVDGRDDWSLGALMASLPSARVLAGASRCVFDFLLFRDIVQDHTADLWQTSAARYDTDHYGGRGKDRVLPGGYDCIVRGLARSAAPAEIRTGRAGEVTQLRWSEQGIEISTADGKVERAERAIVTVPLGVLKAGLGVGTAPASTGQPQPQARPNPPPPLLFVPRLPSAQLVAIHRLGWGEALKVGLHFPKAFWPSDAHFLGKVGGGCGNLGSARHMEFLNVAAYAEGAPPVLLMETEQEHARQLAAMDDTGVVRVVTAALRKMYPEGYVEPIGHVVARLGEDPFLRGAFTFMPTGATHELHTTLGAPLARGRLLLAGEHTSALHAGTVHGAIVAGRKAAAHVSAAMRGDDVVQGGEEYEKAYTKRLFAHIYRSHRDGDEADGDGTVEEEQWDRNP